MDAPEALRKYLLGPPKRGQGDLGKKVGLSQSQVSLIARGELVPPVDRIPALNRLLGTSLDDWAALAEELRRERAASKERAARSRKRMRRAS